MIGNERLFKCDSCTPIRKSPSQSTRQSLARMASLQSTNLVSLAGSANFGRIANRLKARSMRGGSFSREETKGSSHP